MDINDILSRLEDVKGHDGSYSARCPCKWNHTNGDKNASLTVKLMPNGKIDIQCHKGCNFDEICSSIGISKSDVYNNENRKTLPNYGSKSSKDYGKKESSYYYQAIDSDIKLEKTRFRKADGEKTFLWSHYDSNANRWQSGRNKLIPCLYNEQSIADSDIVYITEGEKDVISLCELGYKEAVSLPDGAKTEWHQHYSDVLKGKKIYIFPDNDAAGKKYADAIIKNLKGICLIYLLNLKEIWPELPEKGDITDIREHLQDDAKLAVMVSELCQKTEEYKIEDDVPFITDDAAPGNQSDSDTEHKTKFIPKLASSFGENKVDFVWFPYLPIGEYSVLLASGGTGKTILCCGIAAAVTRGEMLPGDAKEREPSNVLFISAEDDGALLKERLEDSGADLDRIPILDRTDSQGLNFTNGYTDFKQLILDVHPRLVFIDPWHAFIGEDADVNKINVVRPIFQRLASIAKEAACSIVLISHVNKRTQTENFNNSAIGSADLINAARSALTVMFPDDDADDDSRILVHTKSNYAKAGRSVKYRIISHGGIVWDGFSDVTRRNLEEAARKRTTVSSVIKKQQISTQLIDAIYDIAAKNQDKLKQNKTINVSYDELKAIYGAEIFGGMQSKKALDNIADELMDSYGLAIITGKQVNYKGTNRNGFGISQAVSSAQEFIQLDGLEDECPFE